MTALFISTYLILWGLVIVQMAALAALYHHFGSIHLSSRQGREAHGPAIDTQLSLEPELIRTLAGKSIEPGRLRRPALLLFVSTSCGPCAELRSHIVAFASEEDVLPLVVCGGPSEAVVAEWSTTMLERGIPVAFDDKKRVASRLGLHVTPFLVGLDATGVVRTKGIVNDVATLRRAAEVVRAHREPEVRDGEEFLVMHEQEVSAV